MGLPMYQREVRILFPHVVHLRPIIRRVVAKTMAPIINGGQSRLCMGCQPYKGFILKSITAPRTYNANATIHPVFMTIPFSWCGLFDHISASTCVFCEQLHPRCDNLAGKIIQGLFQACGEVVIHRATGGPKSPFNDLLLPL